MLTVSGTERRLSKLQKDILRRGLIAHYGKETDLACKRDYPGCFRAVGLGLPDKDADNRRAKASKRAAAGRALQRLIKRGLVEPVARGHWRLSSQHGVEVAARLWPQIKKPTPEQMAADVGMRVLAAEAQERFLFESWRDQRLERRLKKAKEARRPKRMSKTWIVQQDSPGVSVNFDF
jgi:hypothetical protein